MAFTNIAITLLRLPNDRPEHLIRPWKDDPWESLSKNDKIKRGFYVAGIMLLKALKGVAFVIAALFASVFGLASKQNRRRK